MIKVAPHFLEQQYFTGQVLIATPQIIDSRFSHSVVLICGHDHNGAMGLILNQLIDELTFKDLVGQLSIQPSDALNTSIPVHFGGPIEMGRGFVLHSTDYLHETSIRISDEIALTSTLEILNLLAQGKGPKEKILALGYAGWGAGQLEMELQKNSWLQMEADPDLVFSRDLSETWQRALKKMGVDAALLSSQTGHA